MEYFKNNYLKNNEKEFHVDHGMIGAPTSPQTANQIQEATSRLNAGVKNVELSLVSPEVFETIPKQHFKEVKRMGDLTDAKISLHAPAQMDLAGFSKEGWSEGNRMQAERNMQNIMDRGADLGDNAIVNVHSSGGIPAYEWQKEKLMGEKWIPPGKKRKVFVIDQSNPSGQGSIMPLEYEEKEYFRGTKKWTPKVRMEMLNESRWDQEKLQLFNYEKEKAELFDRLNMLTAQTSPLIAGDERNVLNKEEAKMLDGNTKKIEVIKNHIKELNVHMDTQLQDLHDKFSRYTPDKEKDMFFKKYKTEYNQLVDLSKKEKKEMKTLGEKYEKKYVDLLKREMDPKVEEKAFRKIHEEQMKEVEDKRVSRERLLNVVQKMPTPKRYIPTDKFAEEKVSETVANSAFYAYDKNKEKAPVIAVENVMPDWTLGRADTLKKAILESRKKFAKKLRKEKHLSEDKSKEVAEKLIGATWDVGHIAQLRKFGYSDEDIAKEAKEIAPVVKHIHITDNFGFNDTHLPPGYGTVPIKEQVAELKKKLGKKYEKVAHIVEAGGFVAQFKTSPHLPTMEYFDSPLYESKASPYWKDIAHRQAEYSMGYGIMFPEKHFEMYGAGFANLPQELGGQVQGDKSRFAGTPNQ